MEDKILALGKGIRRNPTIVGEGDLVDCVDLVARGGELVNMPRMTEVREGLEHTESTSGGVTTEIPVAETLLYVHKVGDEKYYIYLQPRENKAKPLLGVFNSISINKGCTAQTPSQVDGSIEWTSQWAASAAAVDEDVDLNVMVKIDVLHAASKFHVLSVVFGSNAKLIIRFLMEDDIDDADVYVVGSDTEQVETGTDGEVSYVEIDAVAYGNTFDIEFYPHGTHKNMYGCITVDATNAIATQAFVVVESDDIWEDGSVTLSTNDTLKPTEIMDTLLRSWYTNREYTMLVGQSGGTLSVYTETEHEPFTKLRVSITGGTNTIHRQYLRDISVVYIDPTPVVRSAPLMLSSGNQGESEVILKTAYNLIYVYDDPNEPVTFDYLETEGIKKVTSVGNVLIMLTAEGLKYWLWGWDDSNGVNNYKPYNFEGIKDLGVQFGLEGAYEIKSLGNINTVSTSTISGKVLNHTRHSCGVVGHYTSVYGEPQYLNYAGDITINHTFVAGKTYRIRITDSNGYPKTLGRFTSSYYNSSTGRTIPVDYANLVYIYNSGTDIEYINNIWYKEFSVLTFTPSKTKSVLYMGVGDYNPFEIIIEEIEVNPSEPELSVDFTNGTEVDVVKGFANKIINEATEQNKFTYPFLARTAIELIDGTFICPSAPALMMPSTAVEPVLSLTEQNPISATKQVRGSSIPCSLKYRFLDNESIEMLHSLGEMVKGIVVAVTPQLYTYKQDTTEQELKNSFRIREIYKITGLSYRIGNNPSAKSIASMEADNHPQGLNGGYIELPTNDLNKLLEETDSFYIVSHIQLKDIEKNEDFKYVDMENGTLSSLQTRKRLTDDVTTLDNYVPQVIYPYNNRLTEGNLKLSKFIGYSPKLMVGYTVESKTEYKIRVLLNIDGKHMWTGWKWCDNVAYDSYFTWVYYPSRSAKKVQIIQKSIRMIQNVEETYYRKGEIDLQEHPQLNGAYAFNLMKRMGVSSLATQTDWEEAIEGDGEILYFPNELMQSRVDNPFVLDAGLSSYIGHGEIRALSTETKAVGYEAHGTHPINVFTTDGIWAATVSSEGKMQSLEAVSREVIMEGVEPLQTDDAIIFATQAGLRLIRGGEVIDLSGVLDGYDEMKGMATQMQSFITSLSQSDAAGASWLSGADVVKSSQGDSFADLLQGCKMLWDSANGLVRVYGATETYVMDMRSKEWSRSTEAQPRAIVPMFPYSIIQNDTHGDLYQYERAKDETVRRDGFAILRETAFGSPMYKKMLCDIRTIKKLHKITALGAEQSKIRIVVYVSNDRVAWYRLTSLNARAWKWYRVAVISKMTDVDAIEGVICRVDERFGNKLR